MQARTLGALLTGVVYVAASHGLMTRAPGWRWNAVFIVGPMLALLAAFAWQRRQHLLAAIAAAALTGLGLQAAIGGGLAPELLYVAQHAGIHAVLAVVFAATLRPQREPLITTLARRVHASLTPPMEAYSRRVTVAWALYFAAMAGLSVALYALAPFTVWAVFANLVTPLAVLAFFVGEFVLRYRLHPEFERATLADAVRAYSGRSQS